MGHKPGYGYDIELEQLYKTIIVVVQCTGLIRRV